MAPTFKPSGRNLERAKQKAAICTSLISHPVPELGANDVSVFMMRPSLKMLFSHYKSPGHSQSHSLTTAYYTLLAFNWKSILDLDDSEASCRQYYGFVETCSQT